MLQKVLSAAEGKQPGEHETNGMLFSWNRERKRQSLKERTPKKHGRRPDTVLTVTAPDTLLPFLLKNLPGQARNNIKSLLSHHQVTVAGEGVTRHDYPLQTGQEVRINWGLVRNVRQAAGALHILYEDQDVIVVDKPAGMLSMASDSEKENTAYHILTDYVRQKEPGSRIFIVHRLDRDTSGVMMFARNEEAKRIMQDHWKERVEDRAYLALVEGTVEKTEGRVHSWLKETSTRLMYSAGADSGGQEAITHYRRLEVGRGYSLLEIRLETGRKNQIRVHMKDLGHSIAGDKRYGAQSNPLGRLGLHAHILAFRHPITQEILRFETEVPQAFQRMLRHYMLEGRRNEPGQSNRSRTEGRKFHGKKRP